MSVFKRGGVYWFNFWFNGKHIQRPTKTGNKRVAENIERAYRIKLAKGEVGIVKEPEKPIPTLKASALPKNNQGLLIKSDQPVWAGTPGGSKEAVVAA